MNRIKELRDDKGLLQQDLADHLQIKQATVSSWELEKSEPNITTLITLSKLFGCTIDHLVCNDNNESAANYVSPHAIEHEVLCNILSGDKQYSTLIACFSRLSPNDKASLVSQIKAMSPNNFRTKRAIAN